MMRMMRMMMVMMIQRPDTGRKITRLEIQMKKACRQLTVIPGETGGDATEKSPAASRRVPLEEKQQRLRRKERRSLW